MVSLIEIEDLLEAEESGDDIELHYEGNDPEVWDAFEEDITILVEATIDGETYNLEELLIDIVGKDTDEEIEEEIEEELEE